jgi:1,4-alpha-glucan branching enzyme
MTTRTWPRWIISPLSLTASAWLAGCPSQAPGQPDAGQGQPQPTTPDAGAPAPQAPFKQPVFGEPVAPDGGPAGEPDAGDAPADAGATFPDDSDAGLPPAPDAGPEPAPIAGHTFEVWAAFADAVSVVGDFNDWNPETHPMTDHGHGQFSAFVAEAEVGDAYLFAIVNDGDLQWRADPRAHAMVHSAAGSMVWDHGSYSWLVDDFDMPPRDELVVYEMHIGTFHDEPGGGPGTYLSAIERLDHLVDLGVNAVELMPIAEYAADFSWGYNTAYPFAPETAYGAPDDLKRFIDACHQRGIAVLLDVVYNHWGPGDLSMWCFDGECLGDGNGGAYFYADHRRETGWGPRPDFGRAEVREFILDNVSHWLDTYRFDGLRWDSTSNIRTGGGEEIPDGWWLMASANDLVDSQWPDKLMIAEDLYQNDWLTWGTGAGGAGFDSQWDAAFFHPVLDAIITPWDADRDMDAVVAAIEKHYPETHHARTIYTESHDEVANGRMRVPAMIDPADPASWMAKKRSTLGAAVVMTSPGLPMLFQGQELLEDEWFRDTDPLDWSKAETHAGIVSLYRDLIALRRNTAGTSAGLKGAGLNVFHVNHGSKVIALHRWQYGGGNDDVVVVLNFSATSFPLYEVGMPHGGAWTVRFNSDDAIYDEGFGDSGPAVGDVLHAGGAGMMGLSASLGVELPPYSALILSRN